MSGRKALAVWKHEVGGQRERERKKKSNKNNGEEERAQLMRRDRSIQGC